MGRVSSTVSVGNSPGKFLPFTRSVRPREPGELPKATQLFQFRRLFGSLKKVSVRVLRLLAVIRDDNPFSRRVNAAVPPKIAWNARAEEAPEIHAQHEQRIPPSDSVPYRVRREETPLRLKIRADGDDDDPVRREGHIDQAPGTDTNASSRDKEFPTMDHAELQTTVR
jgi:hypothetical protein